MASLRALECLVAVASTGSITEAARILFLSQPAVSHQLVLLEREVGTALFHREARGVRLTAAGRAALPQARRAVEGAESAVRAARLVGAVDGGILRLACGQSLIAVLAPLIREWHTAHPRVHITLIESTSADHLYRLLDGDEVDLVIMPWPVPDRFVSSAVFEEDVVLVASSDHPLADKASVRLTDLDKVQLVHYSFENTLGVWLDRTFAAAGVSPVTVMRTAVTATAPQLAAAGMGVAVCPVSAVGGASIGVVREFTPPWRRELVAVSRGEGDALVSQFVLDLTSRAPDLLLAAYPHQSIFDLNDSEASPSDFELDGRKAGFAGAVTQIVPQEPAVRNTQHRLAGLAEEVQSTG